MNVNRRRFLAISGACLLASPAQARTHRWRGFALGAEAEITIHGPDPIAVPALAHVQSHLTAVEAQFSLFDPQSALSRLNREGVLDAPAKAFRDLLAAVDTVHRATDGLFDPTVQLLWQALAAGRDPATLRHLVGWERVSASSSKVSLGQGQALTLNGIAQGFATDLVTNALKRAGVARTLVNIGEFRGLGGPWRLGISDPEHGLLATRTLGNGAIATSSPQGTLVNGRGHILHQEASPLWSTVSVEAETATIADGLSTALTMAPLDMIETIPGHYGVRRITLIDHAGDLITI